jgi:hypothetical protein
LWARGPIESYASRERLREDGVLGPFFALALDTSSRLALPVALRGLPSWAAGRLALLLGVALSVASSCVYQLPRSSVRVPLFNEKCDRTNRQYFRQDPILLRPFPVGTGALLRRGYTSRTPFYPGALGRPRKPVWRLRSARESRGGVLCASPPLPPPSSAPPK